jgi:hypothetical protein
MEATEKGNTRRKIYILLQQTGCHQGPWQFPDNSKFVWDCHQCLVELAERYRNKLVLVLGHMGIDGDETADQLAKQGQNLSLPLSYQQRLPGE